MRVLFAISALLLMAPVTSAQAPKAPEETAATPVRGSIVEDRAAKKLIEAGDARLDASEATKAIEVWKSVIERYPRSKHRFDAHLRLGNYYLNQEKAYDRARVHFEAAAGEENKSDEQRAEATLKLGVCFYHARNFGKSFSVMREVIEKFPVSPQVNEAYYYIGLGHFQLGHYSRAIQALEKVGTTLSADSGVGEKLEAGKRLFVRIEDADLAVLEPNQSVKVKATAASGDEEVIECFPVGRNVRMVFGSVPSRLGKAAPKNGTLEVRGGDKIKVTYTDEHTADKQLKVPVLKDVTVIGSALTSITDGAFSETVNGVVLGKSVNLRVIDADLDTSDNADQLAAEVHVYRLKTEEELEAEAIARAKNAPATAPPAADPAAKPLDAPAAESEPEIERWKLMDTVKVTLTESKVQSLASDRPVAAKPQAESATQEETPDDDKSFHTGVFQAAVPLVKTDKVVPNDDQLQALPSDEVRLVYLDEVYIREGTRQVQSVAKALEGNIGGVRVTKAEISDQELKIQTQLRTADALTQIGNRYKEFGLQAKANDKYDQAIAVCEDVANEAQKLRGPLLEQLYVQLWNIY
jgi:TolA-binding protein